MIATVTIPPAAEPVSLDEAKKHLRVTFAHDDDYISGLIKAARQDAEAYLNGAIMAQTLTANMQRFYGRFRLPSSPILGITSISYVDQDGNTQTVDPSVYELDAELKSVGLAYGQSWPDTRPQHNAVTVVFTAGYATTDDVPQAIKQAILLRVGELYLSRDESSRDQSKTQLTMERLLSPYRDYR